MRPRTVALVAATVTGTIGALLHATLTVTTPAAALGKVKCDVNGIVVGTKAVDPIVNHNGDGAPHVHQFFGERTWLTDLPNPNTANYTDLVGGVSNCRLPADTAAYWVPVLQYKAGTPKAGQAVPVQQITAYYRPYSGMGSKFGPGVPYPADTRLVTSPAAEMWNCGQNSGSRSVRLPNIPDCSGLSGKPGYTLTAHIEFPSCWDGVKPDHQPSDVGDTRDNAHYTFPVRGNNGKVCPSSHPVETVQLQVTIQYAYVGKGADVELSSDAHNGVTDGRSLHGDFWNTWDQPAFQEFVTKCVNNQAQYTAALCDR